MSEIETYWELILSISGGFPNIAQYSTQRKFYSITRKNENVNMF